MRGSVRTEIEDYGRERRVGLLGLLELLLVPYTSNAPALRRTDVAAPGGAPSAMSRSTARRNSTRSASRAFGASVRTAAAALSAGTPLATRSASTDSAIVSGGRRTVRSCVRIWGVAPARSAATPASSSGDDASVP